MSLNNNSFETKSLKLSAIKSQLKIFLLQSYKKIITSKIVKSFDEWKVIFTVMLDCNINQMKSHFDEFIVLNVNHGFYKKCLTYILALQNHDIILNLLQYLSVNKSNLVGFVLEKIQEEKDALLNMKTKLSAMNINIDFLYDISIDDSFINTVYANVVNDLEFPETDHTVVENDKNPNIVYSTIIVDITNEENQELKRETKNEDNNEDTEDNEDERYHNRRKQFGTRKMQKKHKDLDADFKRFINFSSSSKQNHFDEFKNLKLQDKINIVNELKDMRKDQVNHVESQSLRILKSNMKLHEKKEVLKRIEQFGGERKGKFMEWFNTIISFPFGSFKKMKIEHLKTSSEIKLFLEDAKSKMDSAIYGHDDAKHKIICHLSKMIRNPVSAGNAICLVGTKGCGKTHLVESGISKILDLPFVTIPLAGLTDGTYFTGHHYTYEGSQPGKLVECIKQTGYLNNVFFLDEVDKISQTERGKEITNQLIKLIDLSQNNHIQDSYLGNFDIDLSKALWIFSCNDTSKIDPILLDRMTVVKTKSLNLDDKVIIARDYLFPRLLEEFKIKTNEVFIEDETLRFLIDSYTEEGGVRKLKEILYEIISEYNIKSLTQMLDEKDVDQVNNIVKINLSNVQNYIKKRKTIDKVKIRTEPSIGNICGLYFSDINVGGIFPIETKWIVSDKLFDIHFTGNLGKVIKESISVAKTVAWEYTSFIRQNELLSDWNKRKQGIHLNFEELSVSKDGPSATCAISLAIFSLLNNILIKNDIAITGEMNLSGQIMKIGGLSEKLFGAKKAGCKIVLFPESNLKDYEEIVSTNPLLIQQGIFEAYPIKTFTDTFQHVFVNFTSFESPKPKKTKKRKFDLIDE
jgi:ATP-dependent Lon protease